MSAALPRPHLLSALLACAAAAVPASVLAQDAGEPGLAVAPTLQRNVGLQPLPGVDIRYDLLSATGDAVAPGRLESRVALPRGQLEGSVLLNPSAPAGQRAERLDTRWQGQMPNALQSLVLGDTY